MKMPRSFLIGGLILLAFSSATAVVVHSQSLEMKRLPGGTIQLVPSPSGYSFDTGRYNFHARNQQTNGLYRGITIYSRAKDPMVPEESLTAYARFARRDRGKPNRWILGQVVLQTYDKSGTFVSESMAKRLILDIT